MAKATTPRASVGRAQPFSVQTTASCRRPASSSAASLVFLTGLGALGARTGGAPAWRGAARVTVWGALAMAATAGIGMVFGAIV
jgi:hypothetical protein